MASMPCSVRNAITLAAGFDSPRLHSTFLHPTFRSRPGEGKRRPVDSEVGPTTFEVWQWQYDYQRNATCAARRRPPRSTGAACLTFAEWQHAARFGASRSRPGRSCMTPTKSAVSRPNARSCGRPGSSAADAQAGGNRLKSSGSTAEKNTVDDLEITPYRMPHRQGGRHER